MITEYIEEALRRGYLKKDKEGRVIGIEKL